MMFIKHYAPNRCLCIKVANSIDHWVEDCRDVTKAGGRGICTKNGSYCEKEKKVGEMGGGGGGLGRCERRSEALLKIKKKKNWGECRCRGLDLTKNHLKMEKKTKKEEKKRKKKLCSERDLNRRPSDYKSCT